MPESSPQSPNKPKKSGLGRGLGSLLGGAVDQDNEVTTQSKPTQQTTQKPTAAALSQNTAPPVPAVATTPAPIIEKPQVVAIPEEQQIWNIAIDRLIPNERQPRQIFETEALKELAASIKEQGILQPITARRLSERQFEIIAGERRWRAAQLAGLHEVPVILKKVSNQSSLELAIIENIQRANLNPMEEAEAFELLMTEYSLTQQQVADKLGKDRSSVANTLRFLSLPPELKLAMQKNELSAGHAKVLLALPDMVNQIRVGKQVIAENLSVRATEKLVAKAKTEQRTGSDTAAKSAGAPSAVSQRLVESLASELQKLIGTKVAIDYADSKGRLSINFYSDDQLTSIVERLREAWAK